MLLQYVDNHILSVVLWCSALAFTFALASFYWKARETHGNPLSTLKSCAKAWLFLFRGGEMRQHACEQVSARYCKTTLSFIANRKINQANGAPFFSMYRRIVI